MACKSKCTPSMIGQMRHRIEVQSTTQTADGAGGFTESWTTVATVWASIEPAKSQERFIAMQTETHVSHVIMCRYNSAITTAKRILFGSRVFDITGVINVNEDNAYMKITAMEGTL